MQVRAAGHIHSDWSYDGKWPLQRLSKVLRKCGYNVLLIAEHVQGFDEERRQAHRQACQEFSSKDFLLIPGIEYCDPEDIVHILVWGNIPFKGVGINISQLLKNVTNEQGVAIFAHPTRKNAWQVFKTEWKDHLTAIEYWNRKTDGWQPSETATDLLVLTGLKSFVGLDFHSPRQFFPLSIDIELDGPLTEENVLAEMRNGNFIAKCLGMPVDEVTRGLLGVLLRFADTLRKTVAKIFRTVNKRYQA